MSQSSTIDAIARQYLCDSLHIVFPPNNKSCNQKHCHFSSKPVFEQIQIVNFWIFCCVEEKKKKKNDLPKMVDKIQDLNLPATVVTRLIKEALPDGINIGKEARSAIARAACIFSKFLSILHSI